MFFLWVEGGAAAKNVCSVTLGFNPALIGQRKYKYNITSEFQMGR